MKEEKRYNSRYIIIMALFIAAAAAMIIKLYDMQIINGAENSMLSSRKVSHQFIIEAPRGVIYDRNGEMLAYNRESNDVYISKAYASDDELNESLLLLCEILRSNNEDYVHSFDKYVLGNPIVFNPDHGISRIIEWQKEEDLLNIPEKEVKNSARELLEYLRGKFGISDEYSQEEAYGIICMRYEILKQRWNYITYGRIKIANDVSIETVAAISEKRHRLLGVVIQKKMVREYGDVSDAAHVLGYVGSITPEELARLEDRGYDGDDVIGKSGIEQYAESYLRGTDGFMEVEADIYGSIIERTGGIDEINGSDVRLTIDMGLQRIAMEAMEETIADIKSKYDGKSNFGDASAGATIVMDIKTGNLLAMASYPTYDPKWFIYDDEESLENRLRAIMDSTGTPMFNRAIQGIYTPGSTFKPIVAIAALESELLDYNSESLIECNGKWTYDNWDYYCLEYVMSNGWFTHGPLTISEGIKTSCNLIFHQLGVAVGIDEIDKWAERFGLGKPTGLDLFGEAAGIRSNREYKYLTFDEKWWSADTGQTSIGQLYNNFTPIQMAVYTSALANGGKRLTPHLIDEITSADGTVVFKAETQFEQIEWDNETFDIIREGMNSVTLDGTAKKIFDNYPINVAGKTGTAETGREAQESSNALFICYAPTEDPQIAIVTVIENGVWGSYTAAVAKKILSAYFGIEESD
ncbi:MAG: penicillin-binding protein 2 [Clostridia bacterium]|nr:penicillin-binding protein 2 [Clostridia bacterium]